jgi:hypothetical protein
VKRAALAFAFLVAGASITSAEPVALEPGRLVGWKVVIDVHEKGETTRLVCSNPTSRPDERAIDCHEADFDYETPRPPITGSDRLSGWTLYTNLLTEDGQSFSYGCIHPLITPETKTISCSAGFTWHETSDTADGD